MKKTLLWWYLLALTLWCVDVHLKDFRYDLCCLRRLHIFTHIYKAWSWPPLLSLCGNKVHFHLLITVNVAVSPSCPKHSIVCCAMDPKQPLQRTWVVAVRAGKDGEKKMAYENVGCCWCHELGVLVRCQHSSSWSLGGWKHSVLLLWGCGFETMSFLKSHLRCIPVRLKHIIHSLTCSLYWTGNMP